MAYTTRRGTNFLAATGWALFALGMVASAASCSSSGGGGRRRGSADAGANTPPLTASVEERLNASVTVANAGPDITPEDFDLAADVTVSNPAGTNPTPTPIRPGDTVPVSIDFDAPQGNVIAAGIRFGDTGIIRRVELPDAMGVTQGTLNFDMHVPDDICDDIGQICHNIQCYEFAVTSAGTLSAANIMPIGLVCNGCTEPTCQELLMCDMPAGEIPVGMPCTPTDACIPGSECFNGTCVGTGTLRISLAFTAISDFDLHVITPLGGEIYFGNKMVDGGTLDVDQCVGTCDPGNHVENVVFTDTAPSGTYEVWVENYGGDEAGAFSIEVAGDVTQTFTGNLTATAGEESMHFMFTAP